MKKIFAIAVAASSMLVAADQTFTGTITDSMCGKDHSAMKMGDDAKCVEGCVKGGAKYALYDGKTAYTLSDQKAPVKFAGKKVTVTGTVSEKTGIITVTKIEAAK